MQPPEDFFHAFKNEISRIEALISKNSGNQEEIVRDLDSLHSLLKKRLNRLTTFDSEKYEAMIMKLREKACNEKRPQRFAFKSKITKPQAKTNSFTPGSANSTKEVMAERSTVKDFNISVLANLNLSNLQNSTVIYTDVKGSVYINNIINSKIVLRCQQCRVHSCENLEIWLENCVSPIVEDCQQIKFFTASHKFQVADFSWVIQGQPSPNYSITRLDLREWKDVSSYSEKDLKE